MGEFKLMVTPQGYLKISPGYYFSVYPLLKHRNPHFKINLSRDLANVLGFKNTDFEMEEGESVIGDRKIDLLANHPYHFIVCCDLCENSVLSGSPVQILKYFPQEKKNETEFDIEFPNNDFKKL